MVGRVLNFLRQPVDASPVGSAPAMPARGGRSLRVRRAGAAGAGANTPPKRASSASCGPPPVPAPRREVKIEAEADLDGKYLLRSSDPTLPGPGHRLRLPPTPGRGNGGPTPSRPGSLKALPERGKTSVAVARRTRDGPRENTGDLLPTSRTVSGNLITPDRPLTRGRHPCNRVTYVPVGDAHNRERPSISLVSARQNCVDPRHV